MTCIAWDGKTLAADKLADLSGLRRTVTKIQRTPDGSLIGMSGAFGPGQEVLAWVAAGADPDRVPPIQLTDNWVGVLRITYEGIILTYERGPRPFIIEDEKHAIGSGRDFALAAMHYGATAEDAVGVAILFETGCGGGIDALSLADPN